MNTRKLNTRFFALSAAIFIAALSRLIPHPADFTPLGAMALFGGCYFKDKRKAYLVPILALWVSDIILNSVLYFHKLTFFYSGFLWTYSCFALIVLIGTFMKRVTFKNVILATITAALLHWLVSDFGVWLNGGIYPANLQGFIACYVAALPFLKNMLAANLIFGGVMFGAFEWAQKKYTVLAA